MPLTLSSAVYAELENMLPPHITVNNDGVRTIKNKRTRNNGGGGGNNNKKKVSYEEMKLRRDRKRDRQGSGGSSDGDSNTKKTHSAVTAAAVEDTICKQIFIRANLLQKVGLAQFKAIKETLCRGAESELSPKEKERFHNDLPELESKAQWAVREESLSMAADWVKVPLDEINQNNFFKRIQHRVIQVIRNEILQRGTQGWNDWMRSNVDWKLGEWLDDYTKKAVSWLARRVIKEENGRKEEEEEEEEEEDEDKCELYKYHFIRLKKEMGLPSIVKLLREQGITVIVGGSLYESEEEKESETVEKTEVKRVVKEAAHAAEEARLKDETEAKKKKTSKAAALEASEKAEEEKKKETRGFIDDLNKTTKKKTAEQVTERLEREKKKKKKPEEQADCEDKKRVEEVEKQRKRRQQLPKDIRRALASVLAKQEEEAKVEKAKQQQETEAAETRQREAAEEQERQKEARKMERKEERRRKKKEERRLRKVEPAKWEQKKEWLQKEKTGQLPYCQFCGKKASIVCRGCYDVSLCIPSDCCAKIHSQKCSTYYVHETDEVD